MATLQHLCNLEALPEAGFRFFAVPVRVRGMGTFPVRTFAVAPEEEPSAPRGAARGRGRAPPAAG